MLFLAHKEKFFSLWIGEKMPVDDNEMNAQTSKETVNEEAIVELELRIKELKRKKSVQDGYYLFSTNEKWKTILFIIPLIILSLLPSLFIVFD
jgi:hypothetical protein